MAMTTVQAGLGFTVNVQTAAQNVMLAEKIAFAISTSVQNGTDVPALSSKGPPPALPAGTKGAWFQQTGGVTFLPPGYADVVDSATGPASIIGSGDQGQQFLSGNGNVLLVEPGGQGTIAAAKGNHWITLMDGQGVALTDGNGHPITDGNGHPIVTPPTVQDWLISAAGNTTVYASGAGNDTIEAVGARTVVVGGSANIDFIGGAGNATVIGGRGSDTIAGGSGRLLAEGGSAGNNILLAGTGHATLFGTASGDQLTAQGFRQQLLVAGTGAETLTGAMSGGRADTFEFLKGNHGTDTVNDFSQGVDKIDLDSFGNGAITAALKSQVSHGGMTTITLSDKTKITFTGVSHLTKSDFI